MKPSTKVALVCDWLTGVGGAERVILAVHELFPTAPIYTSQYRPKHAVWFQDANVRTGWLNLLPAGMKRFIPFLRQAYFSHLDLSDYDVVISITGAEAKAVKTRPDAIHLSYMHAPTQYYWTLYDQYVENPGFGMLNPLMRLGLKLLVRPLRRADFKAAQRPDVVIANSTYIQAEIKKFYQRDSVVIWPGVDVEKIQALLKKEEPPERTGFIMYGRQVSWKRMDIAIRTVLRTGDHLTVLGDGPEHSRLVEIAAGSPDITFLPSFNGLEEVVERLRASQAFLFPALEPFGIAPVEALAAGTPVIGLKKGGALDFIEEEKNGVFFEEQTPESLADAIERFKKLTFDETVVAHSAERFSQTHFIERLREIIAKERKDRTKR